VGLGTRLLLELDGWLLANTNIDKCSLCQKVVAIATRCSDRQEEFRIKQQIRGLD
jgi:hypothetical protein